MFQASSSRVAPPARPLAEKLQELASRSPKQLHAIEQMVDLILDDLNEHERQHLYAITHPRMR